jgi:hypothetical protein
VLIADSGELYLSGGRHSVLQSARDTSRIDPKSIETFGENLASRRAFSKQMNATFIQLVAPEKYKVYPRGFPIANPASPADRYLQAGLEFVYPVKELRAERGGRTYPATDTHWAPHGLIRIVRLLAEEAGFGPDAVDRAATEMADALVPNMEMWYGDLGRKLDPKRGEFMPRLQVKHPLTVVENGIQHDYNSTVNDGRLIIGNSGRNGARKTILIFGDSYLHHAIPYLSYFFGRVIFCRTRFYHEEMVFMAKPDVIVSQCAERYLGRVFPDKAAPPFLLFPNLLGRTIAPTAAAIQAMATALSRGRDVDFAPFPSQAKPK